MDKNQAKKLIVETFENSFNKEKFILFLKNLLKKYEEKTFTYQGNYIPDPFKEYIENLERIGKYTYEEKEIELLIVKLKRETSLERARAMQRNFIAWYLKGSRGGELKDAALVAFVSPDSEDWRFSLVKMDYTFEETPKGKVKVREEFTPAKRWSFLVGKNEKSHTAQSRFLPIIENYNFKPKLEDLENAFNVEVVTEEFFINYRDLFIRTKIELDNILNKNHELKKEFQNNNLDSVDFAKKLLGQIVFLYFIQKKGWFGVEKGKPWGTGYKDFVRKLFNKEFGDYKNFYNDILEPLFYEALRTDRSAADHYYSRFNCKIPFLNGGLFDPINNFDWVNIDVLLPNELFSNKIETKNGDIGDGILDVFDRYNFTVNEEEPLEKEVALDPELLGKIYEKLNAIRSENFDEYLKVLNSGKKGEETKFNKEFGVYYTPREIVHYMCRESLINYLYTELNDKLSKDDLEKFFQYADFQETEKVANEKAEKIERGEQKSTKYESEIPESIKQNAKKIDKLLADVKICDPAVGSGAFPIGMMHEIVRLRQLLSILNTGEDAKTYDLKRNCIENSIYGVDIDPGAVEICKLRFWLSLIVDEEDFHYIKPLPNLDYKVVCGNSLLEVEVDLFNQNAFNKLEQLKPQYFNETNPLKKQQLKNEIDKLIYEITNGHKEFDFKVYFSEVFHQKDGFDIVIGNPPYIDSETMVKRGLFKEREYIRNNYKFVRGNWDIYIAFFERGLNLLSSIGSLTYITPDKWLTKPFGQELRVHKLPYLSIIVRCGRDVFETSLIDSVITFITSKKTNFLKIQEFIENQPKQKRIFNKNLFRSPYNLDIIFSDNLDLLLKIENQPYKLINLGFCESACATSDAYKLKSLILNILPHNFDKKKFFKIINTGTIGKYTSKWGHREMTFIKGKYLYPMVEKDKFLKSFNKTYINRTLSKKIIVKGITLLQACIDLDGQIIPGKSTLVVFSENEENLLIILALLNSKIAEFYLKERFISYSYNQGVVFTKEMINNIPIPAFSNAERKIFIELINQILTYTQSSDYLTNPQKQDKVKELERQIDQIVYKLYKLTEEEIKIIENVKEG
ncbi:MAG: Eco57I restriction-modification methylase domain-containing protein [candidate division WOR-3 bacterium]